jgi:DNA-binding transcriptional ArsR family regulator
MGGVPQCGLDHDVVGLRPSAVDGGGCGSRPAPARGPRIHYPKSDGLKRTQDYVSGAVGGRGPIRRAPETDRSEGRPPGNEARELTTISVQANNLEVDPEPSTDGALPPQTLEEIELVFAALSHEVRRHIVQLLSHLGGELPSGYLAKRFAHSWPTTTRHLHVLESAGLVSVRREGRTCVYRLERDRLRGVVGGWLALLDPPTPEHTWRSSGSHSVTKGKQP